MMMSLYMEIVIKNQVMIPEVMEIYGNELILFLMIPEVMRIYGNELILFLMGTLRQLDHRAELMLGHHTLQVGVEHLYFIIFTLIELLDLLPFISCISMENC
jgi:hypothetical protein